MLIDLQGAYPSYFVYGPLVFSAVTAEFTGRFARTSRGAAGSIGSPLITRRGDPPLSPASSWSWSPSPFFPHKLSKGTATRPAVDQGVNGVRSRTSATWSRCCATRKDEFVTFDFDGRGSETLVFTRKEGLDAPPRRS